MGESIPRWNYTTGDRIRPERPGIVLRLDIETIVKIKQIVLISSTDKFVECIFEH